MSIPVLTLQVSKQSAQTLPRVVKIRASSPARYAQQFADLRVRKALDIMQNNH
jgi:hypothetical protein